jgi:uncharacterized protein (TIGR02145 family)
MSWYPRVHGMFGGTKEGFGLFYNWYAIDTGKLAPTGWHVATNIEFTNLINYAGGLNVAGGKLKQVGTTNWRPPNTGATDNFGFRLMPSGEKDSSGSVNLNYETIISTSTSYDPPLDIYIYVWDMVLDVLEIRKMVTLREVL